MEYGYGWVEVLGFISGALGLSIALPQLFKVLKADSHVGVSILTWILIMLNFASWMAFSLRMNSPSQFISNVIAVLFTAVLVFVLLKDFWGGSLWAVVFIVASVGLCVFLILVLPEWWMDGVLILAISSRVPQVFSSWKSLRTGRHTNVSLLTYTLSGLSSVGWVFYGLITGLYMNVLSSTIGLVLSMIVLWLEIIAYSKYSELKK